MKIFIFVFLFIGIVNAGKKPLGHRKPHRGPEHKQNVLLNKLNTTAAVLSAVKVTPTPSQLSSDLMYVWDLIPASYKFLLLNQYSIRNVPSKWDVQRELNKTTRLEWNSLPDDVKTNLILIVSTGTFLNTTFYYWNWVTADNQYANNTLLSIIPQSLVPALTNSQFIFNSISLSDIVNITALSILKNSLYQSNLDSDSMEDSELIDFDELLGHGLNVRGDKKHGGRFNGPRDVFKYACLNAQLIIKMYGIVSYDL